MRGERVKTSWRTWVGRRKVGETTAWRTWIWAHEHNSKEQPLNGSARALSLRRRAPTIHSLPFHGIPFHDNTLHFSHYITSHYVTSLASSPSSRARSPGACSRCSSPSPSPPRAPRSPRRVRAVRHRSETTTGSARGQRRHTGAPARARAARAGSRFLNRRIRGARSRFQNRRIRGACSWFGRHGIRGARARAFKTAGSASSFFSNASSCPAGSAAPGVRADGVKTLRASFARAVCAPPEALPRELGALARSLRAPRAVALALDFEVEPCDRYFLGSRPPLRT